MDSEFRFSGDRFQRGAVSFAVLRLTGWLDAQGEDPLVEAARSALAEGAHCLVLDLGALSAISSAGVRAMQRLYKLLAAAFPHDDVAHLKLCAAQPAVRQVLDLTGFLNTMPMYESLSTALESYEG